MRIGIFGGTFDPVHLGHLELAQSTLKKFRLDKIYFVPAKSSPFKRSLKSAPSVHRLSMLKLVLRGRPKFNISEYELKRPGPSYTIRTVKFFHGRFPKADLFLIMGKDSYQGFSKWRESKKIRKTSKHVVGKRKLEISSTQIRERAKKGLSLSRLVPKDVEKYIVRNGLYRG